MAPRKDYTPDQIAKAVEAVRNGEKIATAAKRFGVPRITLHDKITGKTPIGCAMGPSTVLTKSEEDILERWILALSEKHIPLTKDTLLDSVQKIITDENRPNPFTNNRPSKKWFQSFLKRHPNVTQRVPENLSRARDNVTENNIRAWFKEIESYLDENNLKTVLDYPHRLFNADESAFFLSPKPGRILAKKGEKHLYSSCGDEKDNLTVLITGNAAGDLAPPMIVFNYERIPAPIAASVPDEWAIGKSETGWMCSSTFYEYITNVFNPWLEQNNIEKPILFFVDGHKSHLTLHLSNFCSENGIEVLALYPNSTHILQPMDLSVFRPLKSQWKKAVTQWKMENSGRNLRKENFAPVLQKALTNLTHDCVKNGFRAGGIFPFGPDYIDMSKIRPTEEGTQTQTNTAQKEFVKYLEREIVKVFSAQKLNQFNKLYFENRCTLESNIPNEDVALYLIWAKNKSEDALCHSNSTDAPSTSNALEEARCLTNNGMTAPTTDVLTEEPLAISSCAGLTMVTGTEKGINSVQNESSSKDANSNDFMEIVSSAHNSKQSVVDAAIGMTQSLPVEKKARIGDQALSSESLPSTDLPRVTEDHLPQQTNYDTEVDTVINQPLRQPEHSSPTDLLEVTRNPLVQQPNNNTKIDNMINQPLPPPELSSPTDLLRGTGDHLIQQPQNNTKVKTVINQSRPPTKLSSLTYSPNVTGDPRIQQSNNKDNPSIDQALLPPETSLPKIIRDQQPIINMVQQYTTPQKKTMEGALGVVVPSPFKRSLFWPENLDSHKKRIKREKIPSTITSKAWKEYHEKKEADKNKKQQEKEERARQRIEKKRLKEQSTNDKKNKTKPNLKRKKIVHEESTSEDSDVNISYAESDNSYDIEDDEEKERERANITTPTKQLAADSLDSDSENVPLSKLGPSKAAKSRKGRKFSIGNFVIIKYEGEYFPGKIESLRKNDFEISTMTLTTGNSFKWPNPPDKIFYSHKEIIEQIKEPVCLNKRGFYRVPEMDKYLPQIYGL